MTGEHGRAGEEHGVGEGPRLLHAEATGKLGARQLGPAVALPFRPGAAAGTGAPVPACSGGGRRRSRSGLEQLRPAAGGALFGRHNAEKNMDGRGGTRIGFNLRGKRGCLYAL